MGRKNLGRALDDALIDADLEPGCERCGGPGRHPPAGVITTINSPELPTCPVCAAYVNAAGRAVSKRLPDGSTSLKHIDIRAHGVPPSEVAELDDPLGEEAGGWWVRRFRGA